MVETLQVAMISKRDALAPLPVMYNSYILALVEGFAKLHEKLEACEMDLKELKFQREKDLEQFGAMSEEWMQRDDSYKKEIKRLELLLAKESKDGMASVVLARSDTLVDRSGSTHFQSRLKRLSSSHDGCRERDCRSQLQSIQRAHFPQGNTHHKTVGNIPRILDPHTMDFQCTSVRSPH
ncbi:hypothetical protein P8C59_006889 [Phyllachora maydis]|uniref:Uncharacterized protein n=1 Tax=Phyllachora maydis TaxID=1825666 RepID=A0AAD9MHD2_9PEZI|nr:hypothetical protein P8C59_006889 [Phyllachora maydis]